MQKVSYMGNDETTEFYFNFPYFETSNVVVTKNGTPATGCNIIGNSGGLDADYPFVGGKVVFETAPTSIDCITIVRQLPLERIVDYQPLSKIDPTTLNQDLNYLMEVIKDRKDELVDLTTKYAEIADKESTEIILARISAIHDEIVDIDAKIRALGDIGTLQQRVTDLTTTVGGHTTSIGDLTTTVGGHTTSINNLNTQKANIDMDNLSVIGKNTISHMSMPSDTFVELTLGASGATYTAPADGWFMSRQQYDSGYYQVDVVGKSIVETNTSNTQMTFMVPVRKGQSLGYIYSNLVTTGFGYFGFLYANGAQ